MSSQLSWKCFNRIPATYMDFAADYFLAQNGKAGVPRVSQTWTSHAKIIQLDHGYVIDSKKPTQHRKSI